MNPKIKILWSAPNTVLLIINTFIKFKFCSIISRE